MWVLDKPSLNSFFAFFQRFDLGGIFWPSMLSKQVCACWVDLSELSLLTHILISPLNSSACMFKDGIMDVLIDSVYKIGDFLHWRAGESRLNHHFSLIQT